LQCISLKIYSLHPDFLIQIITILDKIYSFQSHNVDFSALSCCCVLKCTDWSLDRFDSFQMQYKRAHDQFFFKVWYEGTPRNFMRLHFSAKRSNS